MSLRFTLDEAKQSYHPGDRVSGRVLLDATEDIDVTHILVAFLGRTKTRAYRPSGGDRQVHRGRVTLFEERQTVFNGHYTLRKQIYEWPFSFVFPTDCRNWRGDHFQEANRPIFDVNPAQKLPPTFDDNHDSWSWLCNSYIQYELVATVEKPSGKLFHSSNLEHTYPITLLPCPTTSTPTPNFHTEYRTYSVQSMHLSPSIGPRPLTLKERMSAAVHHSKLPTEVFTINVHFPTHGIPGTSLPITLSMTHDLERSTHGGEIPMIYLKKYELSLISHTYIRCVPAPFSIEFNDPSNDWTVNLATYTPGKEEKNLHVPIPEALDLRTLDPNRLTLSSSIKPSFRTFNISRSYSLRLKLEIECVTEKLHADFVVPQLQILPAWGGTSLGPVGPSHSISYNRSRDSDEIDRRPEAKYREAGTARGQAFGLEMGGGGPSMPSRPTEPQMVDGEEALPAYEPFTSGRNQ